MSIETPKVVCPRCERTVRDTMGLCPHCGGGLSDPVLAPPGRVARGGGWLIGQVLELILPAGVVLVLAGLLVVAVFGFGTEALLILLVLVLLVLGGFALASG